MSLTKIGVAGPVGSGKTALIEVLTRELAGEYSIGVITNDIYTKEDASFLAKNSVISRDRIAGVETGGCPHTAIREDASMNLEAVEDLVAKFPDIQLLFIESGGDNLSATFSPAADYHPKQAMKVNYGSTRNLINAIYELRQEAHTRFVYIGTVAETGDRTPPPIH